MMHTFIIEGRLAGLNELIAAERANRYKGAQMKRNAQTYVEYAVKTQKSCVLIKLVFAAASL